MYELTLNRSEREAFDWVGHRYASSGDDFVKLLYSCAQANGTDIEWSADEDITYRVPERVAWQLNDLAESEDYLFPCFSPVLAGKLRQFCAEIV